MKAYFFLVYLIMGVILCYYLYLHAKNICYHGVWFLTLSLNQNLEKALQYSLLTRFLELTHAQLWVQHCYMRFLYKIWVRKHPGHCEIYTHYDKRRRKKRRWQNSQKQWHLCSINSYINVIEIGLICRDPTANLSSSVVFYNIM